MNSVQCNKCGSVVTRYSIGLGCACGNVSLVEVVDDNLVVKAKDYSKVYVLDDNGGVRFLNLD